MQVNGLGYPLYGQSQGVGTLVQLDRHFYEPLVQLGNLHTTGQSGARIGIVTRDF